MALLPAVALLVVPLMAVLLLIETGTVTAMGYEAQRLEVQKHRQLGANQLVEGELGALASLDRIAREAKESLQMASPKDPVYIKVEHASPTIGSRVIRAQNAAGSLNTKQGGNSKASSMEKR